MKPNSNDEVKIKRNKKVPINKEDEVILDPETKPPVKEETIVETKKRSASMKLMAAFKRLEVRRAAQQPKASIDKSHWTKSDDERKASDLEQRANQQEIQKKIKNEEVQIDEVLSIQQRRKKAINMRRHKAKMKKARVMAMKRAGSVKSVTRRAQSQARKSMRKRVAGSRGMDYNKMPPSTKMAIDRLLASKKKNVAAIAKKLKPFIRQSDSRRLSAGKKRVSYSAKPVYASYELPDDKLMQIAEEAYNFYTEEKASKKKKVAVQPTPSPVVGVPSVFPDRLQQTSSPNMYE